MNERGQDGNTSVTYFWVCFENEMIYTEVLCDWKWSVHTLEIHSPIKQYI